MVLTDVVLVLLRLVDDDKFLLNELGELNFLPLFDDGQLSFFELGDGYDVVVVVVVLVVVFPGLDASWCPDQPPLCC